MNRTTYILCSAIACLVFYGVGRWGRASIKDATPVAMAMEDKSHTIPTRSVESPISNSNDIRSNISSVSRRKDIEAMQSESTRTSIQEYTTAKLTADSQFLTSIGITPEQFERLKNSLNTVHERANSVQESILALSKDRMDHDAMMRSFLSPDDYNKYKTHEMQKAYSIELKELIQPFIEAKEMHLGEHESTILNALVKASATTLNFSEGPYDERPNPTSDPAEAKVIIKSEIDRIRGNSSRALLELKDVIPAQMQDVLRSYYESRISELNSRLFSINRQTLPGDAESRRALEYERERLLEQNPPIPRKSP